MLHPSGNGEHPRTPEFSALGIVLQSEKFFCILYRTAASCLRPRRMRPPAAFPGGFDGSTAASGRVFFRSILRLRGPLESSRNEYVFIVCLGLRRRASWRSAPARSPDLPNRCWTLERCQHASQPAACSAKTRPRRGQGAAGRRTSGFLAVLRWPRASCPSQRVLHQNMHYGQKYLQTKFPEMTGEQSITFLVRKYTTMFKTN